MIGVFSFVQVPQAHRLRVQGNGGGGRHQVAVDSGGRAAERVLEHPKGGECGGCHRSSGHGVGGKAPHPLCGERTQDVGPAFGLEMQQTLGVGVSVGVERIGRGTPVQQGVGVGVPLFADQGHRVRRPQGFPGGDLQPQEQPVEHQWAKLGAPQSESVDLPAVGFPRRPCGVQDGGAVFAGDDAGQPRVAHAGIGGGGFAEHFGGHGRVVAGHHAVDVDAGGQ